MARCSGAEWRTFGFVVSEIGRVQRLSAVLKGGTATVSFGVTADTLAVVSTNTGDLVASAGGYTLMFDDGSGEMLEMTAAVVGRPYVVDPFPAETP